MMFWASFITIFLLVLAQGYFTIWCMKTCEKQMRRVQDFLDKQTVDQAGIVTEEITLECCNEHESP